MSHCWSRWKKIVEIEKQEDEDFGDIPDEFLDELMTTLMKDPVILPSLKRIDRTTLLNLLDGETPLDPFSRQEITKENVVADSDLQARILAWVAEKRSQRTHESSAKRKK